MLGQWTTADLTCVQVACVVLWVFALKCMAASGDDLDRLLGQAVLTSLEHEVVRMPVKRAAAVMEIDESQLRKALRGEAAHHLSLNRLVRLPWQFWWVFGPALIYLVAKDNVQMIAEDLGIKRSA